MLNQSTLSTPSVHAAYNINHKLGPLSLAVALTTLTYLACVSLYHLAEGGNMGSQMDFLDRMRQNRCQLKFCCSCWFAWAILCYLLQGQSSTAGCNLAAEIRLLSQGWRYKGTCFTLMANAFLNNISCTECRSLQMYLFFLFFFHIWSLICVLQSSSAISDMRGGGRSGETFCPLFTPHTKRCVRSLHVFEHLYIHMQYECACAGVVFFLSSQSCLSSSS